MAAIIFDPVMGWRRSPGRARASIGHIEWEWDIDKTGYRRLPDVPAAAGQPEVWVFGCSFTEGQCLPITDSYCYLLQSRFPTVRVSLQAIAGYSTLQNLLQLEANLVTARPDVVVFSFMHDHLLRNVAHPVLWKNRARHPAFGRLSGTKVRGDEVFRPAGFLTESGTLSYRKALMPLSEEEYQGMSAYGPDRYTRARITEEIFKRARAVTENAGAQFLVALLRSGDSTQAGGVGKRPPLETPFMKRLAGLGFDIVDADPNLPFEEAAFMPVDIHPNARANRHFADKIGDRVEELLGV